jgi:hypothetical protein
MLVGALACIVLALHHVLRLPSQRLAAVRAAVPPTLVLRPDTHKKHALRKKEEEREEAARAERAAEQSRLLLQSEQRVALRELIRAGQKREAALLLQNMARAKLLPDQASYAACLEAFLAPRMEHKLIVQLAALMRSFPVPLWPGAAEAFVTSTAAQGSWHDCLDWWRELEASDEGARAPVVCATVQGAAVVCATVQGAAVQGAAVQGAASAAREAALLAMVKLERWADAERNLLISALDTGASTAAVTAAGYRTLLRACAEACAEANVKASASAEMSANVRAAAALARCVVLGAWSSGVADDGMLREALAASAASGEWAQGLDLLRKTWPDGAASGEWPPPAQAQAQAQAQALAQARAQVLCVSARLHAGVGDLDGARHALRRARHLARRVDGGEGGGLGLAASDLEALMLACAHQGRWRDVRWLLRAAPASEQYTIASTVVALAACSTGTTECSTCTPFRSVRRQRLAQLAAACAEAVEGRRPGRDGPLLAAPRTAPASDEIAPRTAPGFVMPLAVRPWASAAFWVRLQVVLGAAPRAPPRAPPQSKSGRGAAPAAATEAAEAAAVEAVRMLSVHHRAGLEVSDDCLPDD